MLKIQGNNYLSFKTVNLFKFYMQIAKTCFLRSGQSRHKWSPDTTGPAGPPMADLVAIDGPDGPSMAAMAGWSALLQVVPLLFCCKCLIY